MLGLIGLNLLMEGEEVVREKGCSSQRRSKYIQALNGTFDQVKRLFHQVREENGYSEPFRNARKTFYDFLTETYQEEVEDSIRRVNN